MTQIFVVSPWRDVDRGAYESTQLLSSSALTGSKLNKTKASKAISSDISMKNTIFSLLLLTQILIFMCVCDTVIKSAFPSSSSVCEM